MSDSVTDTESPAQWSLEVIEAPADSLHPCETLEPECVQIPNPQEMCDTVDVCSFKLLSSGTIC